jgi:TPR repeat protein
LNGIGIRKNEDDGYLLLASLALWGDEEAWTLLQSAAASGNSAAEFGMWGYYNQRKDIETGRGWLEKSTEKGNARALCTLAILYEQEGEKEEGLRCYRLAAEKGDADAQTRLALALEVIGADNFKSPQNEESFKWMKAAADQGHTDANYFLGNFYRDGTWVDADPQKAFECYAKAAEQGSSDAMERVGQFYAMGCVVPEDPNRAFQCFQRSAELGNPKGQCQLGLCYLHGLGCQQDTEIAFKWISYAANSGNPIVVQMLQGYGLDVGALNTSFKQYRQLQSMMQHGTQFGGAFDQLFTDEPIMSKSPSGG